MRSLIAGILVAIVLIGCSTDNQYSRFRSLPDTGWAYGDTLTFVTATTDSIVDGMVNVTVVHNNNYMWSNLWLEVSYPGDGITYRDTVEVQLCDNYGHWLGQSIGTTYQRQITLPEGLRLKSGTPISVRHIMRLDTLRDIEQIGVAFSPGIKN